MHPAVRCFLSEVFGQWLVMTVLYTVCSACYAAWNGLFCVAMFCMMPTVVSAAEPCSSDYPVYTQFGVESTWGMNGVT
jgi:hypothetical protein